MKKFLISIVLLLVLVNSALANDLVEEYRGKLTVGGRPDITSVELKAGGTLLQRYSSAATTMSSTQFLIPNGSTAVPSIALAGQTNTGISSGGGGLAVGAAGANIVTFGPAGVTVAPTLYSFMGTSSGATAAGTTIADATQLTRAFTNVATVASGTGVKLPDVAEGAQLMVINLGANNLLLYPPDGSHTINALAAGAALTLTAANDQMAICFSVGTTSYRCSISNGA